MVAQGGEITPVIIGAFASKEVRPGETWKIFLKAQDADGDMNRIICTLEQTGVGVQSAAFIKIREDRRGHLSGYIYLNTSSASGLPFAGCRLTVQIQDKEEHLSQPVSFSLFLNPRAVQQNPPPGIFENKDLGPVQIPFPSTPGP